MEKISLIVPCRNEEEALHLFYDEIVKTREKMAGVLLEIIFVDDGSDDGTLAEMRSLADADRHVKYISFSRNFGKESAMFAGLKKADGEYAAIMDADLQDPPALLPEMYRLIKEEGFDSVGTRRADRKGEPRLRSFFARKFYKLINKISKTEIIDGARDYRLMTRQMIDAVLQISEYNRFSKGIFQWVGFRTKWLEYENIPRSAGKTKWSFRQLLLYSIDGIVAFSTSPLRIASVTGLLLCAVSMIAVIFIFIRTLIFGDPVAGWPSMACIILFVCGLQLLCIGIVSEYLAKTYLETKKRPLYIVKEEDGKK